MKQQFLSVFFCVLFSSTLGHEYLRAHELTQKAKHQHRSHAGLSQFRDNNENCAWQCPGPKTPGDHNDIRLIILKDISIVAVLNITSNVAIAVDLHANIVVLFNGDSGEAVLIDLKAETGISWGKGSNDKLWLASQTSLTAYLLALGSLSKVKDFPNGQSFEIKSASDEILLRISVVISKLGSSIASRLKVNIKVGLSIVVALSKILVTTLGGSLSILIKSTEAAEIILRGGLVELATLLNGLASFAQKITGGLEALLIADVNFKLGLLLSAASSLEAVVALLSHCAHKVDLTKVLGSVLKTPEAFLEIVVGLGQGVYDGVSGIEIVVYQLLLVISNKSSVANFVDVIIQLAAGGGGDGVSKDKFTDVIGQVIEIIQIQISTFKSSEQWQVLLTFFSSLKAGNLKVGGIDISAIVSLIIENGGKTSLNLVVGILLKLSAVVGLSVAIGTLYLRLVFFIISGQGIVYVLQLLPSLNLNLDFSSGKSIISQIVSKVPLFSIIKAILSGDIVGVITSLPVLGDIFKAVSGVLEAAGKSAAELISGLKSSEIFKVLFQWIRLAFGLPGGSQPEGGIAGQTIIGGGISISISFSSSGSESSGVITKVVSESTEPSVHVSVNEVTKAGGGWGYIIKGDHSGSDKGSNNGAIGIKGKGDFSGGIGFGFHSKHHTGDEKHKEDRKPRGEKPSYDATYKKN